MSGRVHGTNVHILPDENLGGVLREYAEVDRNADVGDFVARDGIIRKVTETEYGDYMGQVECLNCDECEEELEFLILEEMLDRFPYWIKTFMKEE